MRKLLLLTLIAAAGWQYYQKSTTTSDTAFAEVLPQQSEESVGYTYTPESRFSCDGRQHCSQMTSRAEAVYFINYCPNTKMDGDHDGIPCENDSRF